MWTRGSEITAVIVAFCAVIAPGAFIAFMLAVLIGAMRTPAPRWVGRLLRMATLVEAEWVDVCGNATTSP